MRKSDVRVFKKPIYLPRATSIGFAKELCSVGDIILFYELYADGSEDTGMPRPGRVLGGALQDGVGKKLNPRKTLVVLQLSDNIHHAYTRYVDIEQVVECVEPVQDMAFLTWFFSAKMPDIETLDAFVQYGACCEYYIKKYLLNGEVRKDWREQT